MARKAKGAGKPETPEERPLSPMQEKFVREYMVDLNATKAAIRAGYSPTSAHSMASQLLADPRIAAVVADLKASHAEETGITAARISEELAHIAFARMDDFLELQPNGGAVLDWSNLPSEKAAAISEVTIEEYVEGKGDAVREVKRTRFKLHDKARALHMLAQRTGFYDRFIRADLPRIERPEDISAALGTLIAEVGAGRMTVADAQALAGMLEGQRRAVETVDLEKRLEAIEQSRQA